MASDKKTRKEARPTAHEPKDLPPAEGDLETIEQDLAEKEKETHEQ